MLYMQKVKIYLLGLVLIGCSMFAACQSEKSCVRADLPVISQKDGAELYTFKVGNSTYIMNPREGALLLSWDIKKANGENRSVIYAGENVVRGAIETIRSGAPVFFPFSGMSFADGKPNQWKSVSGEILPMRKFGFADNGNFEIVSVSGDEILMKLIQTDYTKKQYPYKYDFYVHYKFAPKSYKVTLKLDNYEDFPLPWGVGYHPFLTVPWNKGEKHADYRQVIDCATAYYVDNNNGKLIPTDFKDQSFASKKASRIHACLQSPIIKVGPKHGREDITFILNDGKLLPTMALVNFGNPDKSPYWAVEPWAVLPFAAGRNAPEVQPHSSDTFTVELKL